MENVRKNAFQPETLPWNDQPFANDTAAGNTGTYSGLSIRKHRVHTSRRVQKGNAAGFETISVRSLPPGI